MKASLPVLGGLGSVSTVSGFGDSPATGVAHGVSEDQATIAYNEHLGGRPCEAVQQSDEADEGRVVRGRRWCAAVISSYGCHREGPSKVAPLAAYRRCSADKSESVDG